MTPAPCPTCGAPSGHGCACAPTQPSSTTSPSPTTATVPFGEAFTDASPTAVALDALARQRLATATSLVGSTIGDYSIIGELGRGGQGAVYDAVHTVIGKPVALKVVRQEVAADREGVERLLAEARSMSALSHPRIASVLGYGTLPDGRPYLVMERLTGVPLDRLARSTGLPVASGVTVLLELAEALQAVHDAGLVHRDLKPSNVFLAAEADGPGHVKLLDFGIAKAGRGENILASVTVPGRFVGTLEYAAPERLRGEASGPASDVYSLGCVAWDVFAGRPPYGGRDALACARAHLDQPVPDLGRVVPDVPAELAGLIRRMLAKQPQHRPSLPEVQAVFAAQPQAPVSLTAPARAPAAVQPRRRVGWRLGAAIGLGLLAGAGLTLWMWKG